MPGPMTWGEFKRISDNASTVPSTEPYLIAAGNYNVKTGSGIATIGKRDGAKFGQQLHIKGMGAKPDDTTFDWTIKFDDNAGEVIILENVRLTENYLLKGSHQLILKNSIDYRGHYYDAEDHDLGKRSEGQTQAPGTPQIATPTNIPVPVHGIQRAETITLTNDGDRNREIIQKAMNEAASGTTIRLPEGRYPVAAGKIGGQWVGLSLKSDVTLAGAGMGPGGTELYLSKGAQEQVIASEANPLIYFVRSDKDGANNYGIANIVLDATSEHNTNTLFIGKKGKPEQGISLTNMRLTGGSGDYVEDGRRMGAGYGLDCVGANATLRNVTVEHSRRGAIFTADQGLDPTLSIQGLTIRHINDGIDPSRANSPGRNRHNMPNEKKFGLMLQNVQVTGNNITIDHFEGRAGKDVPLWVENTSGAAAVKITNSNPAEYKSKNSKINLQVTDLTPEMEKALRQAQQNATPPEAASEGSPSSQSAGLRVPARSGRQV